MEKTFSEIIDMMEMAEDYGDLYEAASFIKNQDLRMDVESMIAEYEESDTDVETAYSCVTSDLLDEYMYEDNTEDLGDYASFYPKKESKKVTESNEKLFYGVPEVKFIWHGTNADPEVEYKGKIYNYYDLEDSLYSAFKEEMGSDANDDDFDKWVLDNKDMVYSDLEMLEPITEAKKLSPEDEAHFEEENDRIARQEIEDRLKDGKQRPDEEIEKEMDKITESEELADRDEEDLATLLYTEALDNGMIDGHSCQLKDYEYSSLEEIHDWYSENVTEEEYNKVKSIVEEVISKVKFYRDGRETYIELNDNHTLWQIEAPEESNESIDAVFETEYLDLVNKAADDFEEETGEELYYLGRSGRHVCVVNNFLNAYRYDKFKEVQERLEKGVIADLNQLLSMPLDEGKEVITEGKEVDFDTFASNLQTALVDNGYSVDLVEVDDEGTLDISPMYKGVTLGIMLYKGNEDSAYGYEVDTIGIGGDSVNETVYPLYRNGWDYELGAPKGSPEENQEVYAMFKDLKDVTVEEIIGITDEAFKPVVDKFLAGKSNKVEEGKDSMEMNILNFLARNGGSATIREIAEEVLQEDENGEFCLDGLYEHIDDLVDRRVVLSNEKAPEPLDIEVCLILDEGCNDDVEGIDKIRADLGAFDE